MTRGDRRSTSHSQDGRVIVLDDTESSSDRRERIPEANRRSACHSQDGQVIVLDNTESSSSREQMPEALVEVRATPGTVESSCSTHESSSS